MVGNKYFFYTSLKILEQCKYFLTKLICFLTFSSFVLAIVSKARRLAYNLGFVSSRLAGLIMIREAILQEKCSFFNIVQTGGGIHSHVKKLCCKFCIIQRAFCQHKLGHSLEMSQIEGKIV